MRKGTCFSEVFPQYLSQWHPSNALTPDSTAPSSNKKVLWQCTDNPSHTWEASPNARFKANGAVQGCPRCSGREVDTGVTDLATMFPDVAAQWSPRNELEPHQVAAFSNKKFWWVGECGHTWDASVTSRTRQGDGCPFCSGHRVLTGFNDVASQVPDLLAEWCDERDPRTVYVGSQLKLTWRCGEGHIWEATVAKRASGGTCHYCSGRKVLKGFNDLESQRPDLAKMWHPSNRVSANEVSLGSGFRAKWVCAEGHTVTATVGEKVKAATACAVCEGTILVKGITDFATRHPDVAAQWVGGRKRPDEVRSMSGEISRWKCGNGHPEWEAPFSRRALGHGCPYCAGQRVIVGVNDLASKHPDVAAQWHPDNPVHPSEVTSSSSRVFKWVCEQGHTWEVSPNQRTSHAEGVTWCPECFASGASSAESEVADYIATIYGGEMVKRHRVGRMELDVYLPSLALAVEFNGVHWHSEKYGKGKNYHLNKVMWCRERGITLIQVWEDDWRDRRAVVEKALRHKLGMDTSAGIGARTTRVRKLSQREAREFMESNHIQGFVGGTHHVALVHGSVIVAVITTTALAGYTRIDRYATSCKVPGGFGKLLKQASEQARRDGHSMLVTFSDNEVSNGDLYRHAGFTPSRVIAPDYKYLFKASRVHKFSFRKSRFRTNPNLKYDPSMTEQELAALNKIPRIWDSGKVRWELKV